MPSSRRALRRTPGAVALLSMLLACDSVEVTTVQVARVEVSPSVADVEVDATTPLTAAVLGSNGAPLSGRSVDWTSLDPAVASVNGAGVVRGVAAGTARIRASVEGFADTATVHVAAVQPRIALARSNLSFTATARGESPPMQSVAVSEAGGATLNGLGLEVAYPAGQPGGWVTANLQSSATPTQLSVGAAVAQLDAGTYTATVRVIAAAAANSPQAVQIEFEVEPALPRIQLEPAIASFSASQGGANPAAVQIAVSNAGGGSVSGLQTAITYAGGTQGWLTAELSGTTAPATLTLRAATGALPGGTHSATVRLTSSSASNSPVDIPVTFAVASVAPNPPTGVQASVASAGRIDVSWTASTGAAVAYYRVLRQVGGAGGFAVLDSVTGGTLGYADTGVTPATTYAYRIEACNGAGCSSASSPASATTPQIAPGAPSGLQATAASASRIDLAWTGGSGAVTWYRVHRRSGGGGFAVVDSVSGTARSYQDTGLAPATQYSYRVDACNEAGCSPPSGEASATTPQVAPGSPSSLSATAASSSRIDLSWTASSGSVLWYELERRTGGSGPFADVDSLGGGATSYADTGLDPAVQYTYRLRACNQAGCSGYSNQASATTPQVAPGAPSGLSATAISASRIDLEWTASTGTVTRYRIERRTGGGAFAQIDSVAGGTTTYSNTGLLPGTEYTYRVRACNVAGCSPYSGSQSATTSLIAPGAPTNLVATEQSASSIRLTWDAASGIVTSYRIERLDNEGAFKQIDTVLATATSYTDSGLDPATEYTYRVRACNIIGCSAYTGTASATTEDVPPGAPSALQAQAVGANRIDLTWLAPASGGTVLWYRLYRQTDGGAFTPLDSLAAATTSYEDAGLQPATTYGYRVEACNAADCTASNTATATTDDLPPGAPSALAATAASDAQIDLEWSAPGSGGAVALYVIERRTGGAAFAVIDSVPSGTLTYSSTGLVPESEYIFRVQACNPFDCSAYSNEAAATTEPPVEARPETPEHVSATALSPTEVRLVWSAVMGTEAYRLRMRTGTGGMWDEPAELPATETAHTESGLEPGTTYQFQVAACNSRGCSQNSSPETVTTPDLVASDGQAR